MSDIDPEASYDGKNTAPRNRQQFVDFRVSLYRLRFPDSAVINVAGSQIKVNDILDSSFGDTWYQELSNILNQSNGSDNGIVFTDFLSAFYDIIKGNLLNTDGTAKTSDQLIASGLFVEHDMTPLVPRYSVATSMDGMNTCTLESINPNDVDVTDPAVQNYLRNSSAQSSTLSLVESSLKQFTDKPPFRLFDLVRVWVRSGSDTFSSREVSLRNTVFKPGPGTALDSSDFVFVPEFTGLVFSLDSSNSAGGSSMVSVHCGGLKRMLMQSVTTFSDALAPVVTTATQGMDILQDKFTPYENIFNEMSADQIVRKIISDYFYPIEAVDPATGQTVAMAPNLVVLVDRMFKVTKVPGSPDIKVNLIPMLPTLILIHILKLKYREAILIIDDRIQTDRPMLRGSLFSEDAIPMQYSSPILSGDLPAAMKPYLTQVRSSFSNYDSSYVGASEVFDTIKETTFMELFEDRKGQFHFRFPRYNDARTTRVINLRDVRSGTVTESDTAINTASVAKTVIPMGASYDAISGVAFVDKISILRYGFRKPQIQVNPNALSNAFTAAMAKFSRDYRAGRDGMTARIQIVGNQSLGPGDLIVFRVSRRLRAGKNIKGGKTTGIKTYCGYIISMVDSVAVSGTFTQDIELAFVREANIEYGSSSHGSIPISEGFVWDAVDVLGVRSGQFQPETIGNQKFVNDASVLPKIFSNDVLINFSTKPEDYVYVSARYIPSSIDLAVVACKADVIAEEGANRAAFSNNPRLLPTSQELADRIAANKSSITRRVNQLATMKKESDLVNKLLGVLNSQATKSAIDSGVKKSLLAIGNTLSQTVSDFQKSGTGSISVPVKVKDKVQFISGAPGFDGKPLPGYTVDNLARNAAITFPSDIGGSVTEFVDSFREIFYDPTGALSVPKGFDSGIHGPTDFPGLPPVTGSDVISSDSQSRSRDIVDIMIKYCVGFVNSQNAATGKDTIVNDLSTQNENLLNAKAKAISRESSETEKLLVAPPNDDNLKNVLFTA